MAYKPQPHEPLPQGQQEPQASAGAPYGDSNSASERIRDLYAQQAVIHKDHVSAGLLAIFLGAFGIHKFYLGYNQTAFVMLAASIVGGIVTFGIAAAVVWLISIIEGIIYLTKSQEAFDRIYVQHRRDWF